MAGVWSSRGSVLRGGVVMSQAAGRAVSARLGRRAVMSQRQAAAQRLPRRQRGTTHEAPSRAAGRDRRQVAAAVIVVRVVSRVTEGGGWSGRLADVVV